MVRTFRFSNIVARIIGMVTFAILVSAAGGASSVLYAASLGATAPGLGTAASFAVLGGSTVTNTGPSVIGRDLGVSPGTAITGFPPGIVAGGAIHQTDAVALQAKSDLTTAYNNLAGQACNTILTGQDLGGKTLTPGVYCFSSSAQLTGKLTLDAQGNPNAVFIFQIGSTLTTASTASVSVINSSNPCNVYWQIGSSATLGTGTTFSGNILALASISLATGAGITGRALARVGAVTMDTNNVSAASCVAASPATPTATATATSAATATATATATTKATATATATTKATATATASRTAVPPPILPVQQATSTPLPGPTATAQPPERDATNTPVPAPSMTEAPTATPEILALAAPIRPNTFAILHVPDTGGGPGSGINTSLVLMLGGLGAAGAVAAGLRVRAHRRTSLAAIE